MKETLFVTQATAKLMEGFCALPDGEIGRGEVLFDKEALFPNGHRMAIQVVASLEPSRESAWSQGVLFDVVGNELGCTDVGESFLGEYYVQGYVVEVKAITDAEMIKSQQTKQSVWPEIPPPPQKETK